MVDEIKEKTIIEQKKPTIYETEAVEGGIVLAEHPNVWSPYSARYFIRQLEDHGVFASIQGKEILDLGAGSGVLGIVALKRGAGHVVFADLNPYSAVLSGYNAGLNGYSSDQFSTIESDAFSSIEGEYSLIISNPPVQPELMGVHSDKPSYKTNESGVNGRGVLDRLLIEGRQHLREGGQMVVSASSRHGHRLTTQLLDKEWGEGNWRIMNGNGEGEIEEILLEYHGPYMMYWVGMQMMDMDFRIFQTDQRGKPISEMPMTGGRVVRLVTIDIDGEELPIKLDIHDGEVASAVTLRNNREVAVDLPADFEIPTVADQTWKYKYFIIEATKGSSSTEEES